MVKELGEQRADPTTSCPLTLHLMRSGRRRVATVVETNRQAKSFISSAGR